MNTTRMQPTENHGGQFSKMRMYPQLKVCIQYK